MKNFMIFAALLAAVAARGAIPETAEGWYTPPANWKPDGVDGSWEKNGTEYGVVITADGEWIWGETKGVSAAEQVALEVAVEAFWNTQWNTQYIKTIGENLHAVMSTDGITLSGTDPNGNPVRYTLKFSSGVGTGTTIEATDPSLSYKHTDERSLRWTGANKAEIYGWAAQAASGTAWAKYLTPFALPARTTSGTLEYLNWYGVDNLSLAPSASGPLELKGWSTAGATMTPLAEAMTAEDGVFTDYELVVRNAGKGLNYVSVGKLDIKDGGSGGSPADGSSITTNATDGAVKDGDLSLAGFATAGKDYIPFRDTSSLGWRSLSDWVDGISIAVHDGKLEVLGANAQLAARRYFGTGTTSPAIGWYDLPNVTTNIVEGDEKTITTVENDGKVKTLGLKSMPLPVPSVAANNGGEILWMPLAEVVTNAALLVDNVTVTTNGEDTISLKGWADSICGAKVSEMLTEDGNKDRDKHYLLARYGTGASAPLHYVPFGDYISSVAADGEALIEKEDGVITIAGYPSATEGQVLTHTGSGVTWAEPTGTEYTAGEGIIINEDAEEPSISVDPDYLNSVVGERTAVDGTFVIRDENNTITVDTNILVQASVDAAVAEMPVADGASIIEKEDYTLTIAGFADAADGAVLERSVDGVAWVEKQTIMVVTDVRLDPDTQKLQKKTAYLTFVGTLDEESDWEDL